MRAGFILPGGTAGEQLEQAIIAEEAGWDGIFVWEVAYGVDPWTLLGAVAAQTRRIRLGTLLTPLPWRRPWKLASQVATLDQLSDGRALVTVGLGALSTDLPETNEVTDLRARADLMDEGIDLMRHLWSGGSSFEGHHYRYACARDDLVRIGRPVQDRIPIWVVGVWNRPKSLRRALRCDGIVPQYDLPGRQAEPGDAAHLVSWLRHRGVGPGFDVIAEGETPADSPDRATEIVAPWSEAGCTWWLETRWEMTYDTPERMAETRARLASGPPRVPP